MKSSDRLGQREPRLATQVILSLSCVSQHWVLRSALLSHIRLDDIKLANEMPTTDNGSIKDGALLQVLGPEHRGRLRGGGYGVTPSRYNAQTYASMRNQELRDSLRNVEGKLHKVFDLVLAKQQNEGNGKETNTKDAIQLSTNRPQL
ncbi:unnamed protein product [Malus baccata var. baccata]